MTLDPAHAATSDTLQVSPDATETSTRPDPGFRVPFTMPEAQTYYWRFAWQRDERETLKGLEAGEYVDFDSDDPEDAAEWLREPDDDE